MTEHENRPWPENRCPVCGEGPYTYAKNTRRDSVCANRHRWHTCDVHKVIVQGASEAGLSPFICTCPERDSGHTGFEHHDGLSPTPDHLGAGGIGPGVFDDGLAAQLALTDWLNVFGHLSDDPDEAGNMINSKMSRLEAERDEAREWARRMWRLARAHRALAAYWREQYEDQRRRRMHSPL